MRFEMMMTDGRKSLDGRIRRLVAYVNTHVVHIHAGNPGEQAALDWARKTIEQGIRNLAQSAFANRTED